MPLIANPRDQEKGKGTTQQMIIRLKSNRPKLKQQEATLSYSLLTFIVLKQLFI
ncbi:hypothetical protein [Myroides sp. DF42-4-2]|uniref:hypothetical protein n=1 Tax=unclassified Myroides TaxID=2642485 RepID=UPI0025778629|nr:hypothetical protein [Myroides sp. DF42-4-2]MDM1406441.1 hypothetical protein [Myroides sp. DF42-4-2]